MAFERPGDGWRFNFGGIKTNAAADELPPGKYPYAQNIRQTSSVQTRPGYERLFSLSTLAISTTCPLPTGAEGVVYSESLSATGGVPAYTWSIVGGSLPDGLHLNSSTGAITGTPTTEGTESITIKVTDSVGSTITKHCSITINAGLAIVTTCPLTSGEVGVAYSVFLEAEAGVPPYTWTIFSGALPGGLSLNSSTGEISGTPTTGGDSTFTLRVTDDSGEHVDKSCSLCIDFVATDDFNRADGPIDVGQPEWVKFASAGMPVIISNQIKLAVDSGNFPFVWWNSAGNNPSVQSSKLVWRSQSGVPGSRALAGPAVMMGGSDSSQDMYICGYGPNVGASHVFGLSLVRRVSSVPTTLDELAVTPSTGDEIEIVATVNVSDVTLEVFRNGVLSITYVDSDITRITTGKPGMAQQVGGGLVQMWDNWTGEENC